MALVTTAEGTTATAKNSVIAITDVVVAMVVSSRWPTPDTVEATVATVVRQQVERPTAVATETAISDRSIATATKSTLVMPIPTTMETCPTTKTPR